MKKLYLATKSVTFISDSENENRLKEMADKYLKMESESSITLKQCFKWIDIPKERWHVLLYGVDKGDMTALEFIQDPEYMEYLRLKRKFT